MLREPRNSTDSGDHGCSSRDGFVPLDRLRAAAAFDPAGLDPAQVRAAILDEHGKIRALLKQIEADALALLACSVPKSGARKALRERALDLCDHMAAHIAFENQVLVPVVRVVDAWGPVRAQRIVEEHEEQLELLRTYADILTGDNASNQGVSAIVWQLVQCIGHDMREEEAQVLSPEFLSYRVGQDVETG